MNKDTSIIKEKSLINRVCLAILRILAAIILLPITIGMILNIINPRIMAEFSRLIIQMNRIPIWANWLMLVGAIVILGVLFLPIIIKNKKEKTIQ